MSDSTSLKWRKSTRSNASGMCVEVAALPGGQVGVRDSKDPNGGHLTATTDQWAAFIRGVRDFAA